MNDLRIVLLGKTGDGKSSTGNTILGEETFRTESSPESVTRRCESRGNINYGRNITVVDGPGFFDNNIPKEELNSEIVRCFTECAPGPHAFLIVLRIGRYTEQEIEVMKNITATFGEEALSYAVVLFTHGDQLSENQTVQDFVRNSAELQELVDKCGGRVHVIDNKYWKQQDGNRSNKVQVEDLLNTIEEMVKKNGGKCYTNKMLQMVQREIEEEMEKKGNEGSEKERIKQAKKRVHTGLSVRLVGVGTGIVVGAVLGCITALPLVMFIIVPKKSLVTVIYNQIASLLDPGAVAAKVLKAAVLMDPGE